VQTSAGRDRARPFLGTTNADLCLEPHTLGLGRGFPFRNNHWSTTSPSTAYLLDLSRLNNSATCRRGSRLHVAALSNRRQARRPSSSTSPSVLSPIPLTQASAGPSDAQRASQRAASPPARTFGLVKRSPARPVRGSSLPIGGTALSAALIQTIVMRRTASVLQTSPWCRTHRNAVVDPPMGPRIGWHPDPNAANNS